MGRLKKDHSGWKTSGKWKKYQYPKIDETPRRVKKSKDTRKWCKGKFGVKHDYELIQDSDWRKIPICKNCKKQDYRGVLYKCDKTGEFIKDHFCWFSSCSS